MLHTKSLKVPFNLCDPAGILFFAEVFTLAHQTLEDWISSSQVGWNQWFNSKDYAVPIRKAETDYFAPIKAGENISIKLEAEEIGQSSITFKFLFLGDTNEELATVRTTHVFVKKDGDQLVGKTPIPNLILELIKS